MHIHCPGQPGHGSLLLDNTAGEKVTRILQRFYEFREQEQKKLKENSSLTIGDVTTVNLTRLQVRLHYARLIHIIDPKYLIYTARHSQE